MAEPRKFKTVGELIDAHEKLRQKKQALEAQLKEVKRELAQLGLRGIRMFGRAGVDGAKGRVGIGRVEELQHLRIEEYDEFTKYVHRTRRYELFQRRPSKSVYDELIELGEKPKGLIVIPETKFYTVKRRS